MQRPLLVLLAALMVASYAGAASLTKDQIIEVARRIAAKDCSDVTPCTFDAHLAHTRWVVRVQFTRRNSPTEPAYSYPGGDVILIIDADGKLLGKESGE